MSRRAPASTNSAQYYRKQIRRDPPKIVDAEHQYSKEKEYLQLFIQHPHHHVIRAAFFEDSSLTIIFPLAPRTLKDCMQGGSASLPALYDYLRTSFSELAAGLTHIHAMHVTHNDLKPKNVLVTEQGTIQITDFGSASRMNEDGTQAEHILDSLGDARYMTPDEVPYGYPRDIWALSVMFVQIMNTRLGIPSRQFTEAVYSRSFHIIPDQLLDWVDALRNHRRASQEDKLILRIANRGLDENPIARPSAAEIFHEIHRGAPTYIESCCD